MHVVNRTQMKTVGGYRTQHFTPPRYWGGARKDFSMGSGNIPLFMRCGAYRALLELKMLWPHANSTPKNLRGG